MELFLSTTFYGESNTNLAEILPLLNDINIDGIELGSTHKKTEDLLDVALKYNKRIVTHNFFPPAEDPNFIVNLASEDTNIRNLSLAHARYCIEIASRLGAEVYTVHPGFMAVPTTSNTKFGKYDFNFDNNRTMHRTAFNLMIDSLDKLRSFAIGKGVKLAIETEGSLTNQGVLLMETLSEYDKLFSIMPDNIFLNINLAHTHFASKIHGYTMHEFIDRYRDRIVLAEVSHNDGASDQHLPLVNDSYVFNYLDMLPNVPFILEFRNSKLDQIQKSIALMRSYSKGEFFERN